MGSKKLDGGIDYGQGQTNIDLETGVRYGIIAMNSLDGSGWETMASGDDLDFEAFKREVCSTLRTAIEGVLEQHRLDGCNDALGIAQDTVDNLEFDSYESSGDCTRYSLRRDGYALTTTADGNLFVIKSPYYTFAQYCSPCVPGAGNLDVPSGDGPKTYCLASDWFDDVRPCRYPVYRLDTDEQIYEPDVTGVVQDG